MAVDLGDLVESAKAAIDVPGGDLFPSADDDDWILRLTNGFWTGRLRGLWANYTEAEGIVTPVTGTADLGRDQQQLIILYTVYTTVFNRILAMPTRTRRKAGPVETETERSATTLQALLKDIRSQIDEVIAESGTGSRATTVAVFNAVFARDEALLYGDDAWIS